MKQVRKQFRITHNDEFRGLYGSSKFVRIVKSRKLRWAWEDD